MIEANRSFAQLGNQPLPRIELEGIIGGLISQDINPPGLSFTLAPHGDDVINDVSLDAKVIVCKPGDFDDKAFHALMSAKHLGNRIRVVGSYTLQERGYNRVDAEVVEIQPYS